MKLEGCTRAQFVVLFHVTGNRQPAGGRLAWGWNIPFRAGPVVRQPCDRAVRPPSPASLPLRVKRGGGPSPPRVLPAPSSPSALSAAQSRPKGFGLQPTGHVGSMDPTRCSAMPPGDIIGVRPARSAGTRATRQERFSPCLGDFAVTPQAPSYRPRPASPVCPASVGFASVLSFPSIAQSDRGWVPRVREQPRALPRPRRGQGPTRPSLRSVRTCIGAWDRCEFCRIVFAFGFPSVPAPPCGGSRRSLWSVR